ncbi:MAG: hypothetical protein RLZZ135_2575 [Cyanobacteriota bacterium]|jgi:cytochrome b561
MSLTAKSPIRNNIFKQLMTIHWWMALLYLVLFATGIPLEKVQKSITLHDILIAAHKSFGILVLILLIWRLLLLIKVWGRKYLKHLPQFTRRWYFKTGLHTFLYLMMLVVPLSGYWLSNAFQAHNTSMFGLPMPDIFPANDDVVSDAATAHGITSKIFQFLIFVHAIAQYKVIKANWHRLTDWIEKLIAK